MKEIKPSREEERAIDQKLGPDFKKKMNEFADKLADLMMEFPMAQGRSREAQYLQQPFSLMSGACRLVKRFGMTEEERDVDDAVLNGLANVFKSLTTNNTK